MLLGGGDVLVSLKGSVAKQVHIDWEIKLDLVIPFLQFLPVRFLLESSRDGIWAIVQEFSETIYLEQVMKVGLLSLTRWALLLRITSNTLS